MTRDEFILNEIELGIRTGEPYLDAAGPDLSAIARRAVWNAEAAERAGVVWNNVKGCLGSVTITRNEIKALCQSIEGWKEIAKATSRGEYYTEHGWAGSQLCSLAAKLGLADKNITIEVEK